MKRAFKLSGSGSTARANASEGNSRILRDLDKLEQIFRQWLRTGSIIDSHTIQLVLEGPYLGFTHRAPRGGGSHSTLTHPSGQIVGLIAGTEARGSQIAAAKAGLAVLEQIRPNILKTDNEESKAQKPKHTWRQNLEDIVPEAFDLLPMDGEGKAWVLRSRSFPQVGSTVYEGMPQGRLVPVLERLAAAQAFLNRFMERADALEFDVLHQEGTLTLVHRVHQALMCVLKPYDPLAQNEPENVVRALEAFEARLGDLDREAENKRLSLLDTRLYVEHTPFNAPDGGCQIVLGQFLNPLTDDVYQSGYTKSPQGRIYLPAFLKMTDDIYNRVFSSLKKDAVRFYGLDSTRREEGLIRLRHPYIRSIDVEMLDLRESSLCAAYKKAADSGLSKNSEDGSLFEDKIGNLARLLVIRNEMVGYIDSLTGEYNKLVAFAQRSSALSIGVSQERTPGKEGTQTFSYEGENDAILRHSLSFVVRAMLPREVDFQKQKGVHQNSYLGIIPHPEKLLGLYDFLLKGRENLWPLESALPPYPIVAASLAVRNTGQTFPKGTVLSPFLPSRAPAFLGR